MKNGLIESGPVDKLTQNNSDVDLLDEADASNHQPYQTSDRTAGHDS